MKFEYVGGLLYAEISVFHDQEVKLRAMIDTGSAGTAAEIDRFKIDPHKPGSRLAYIVGAGGRHEVITQPVSRISIAGLSIPDFEVQFCDLLDQFQFEAIIGSELLEKLGAVIDYPKREITFTKQVSTAQ